MKEKKTRVLIVEDEAIISQSLQYMLENLGYEVAAICTNGEEAIVKATQLKPDIILMDIQLGDEMDGIQAAEKIKELNLAPPLVYITAYSDESIFSRAKFTLPFGYILKPFDSRELQICIEMALHKNMLEQEIRKREHLLKSILKSTRTPLLTTDYSGRISYFNTAAQKFFNEEDLTIFHLNEVLLLEGEEIPPFELLLGSSRMHGSGKGMKWRSQNRWVYAPENQMIERLTDPEGQISGLMFIF